MHLLTIRKCPRVAFSLKLLASMALCSLFTSCPDPKEEQITPTPPQKEQNEAPPEGGPGGEAEEKPQENEPQLPPYEYEVEEPENSPSDFPTARSVPGRPGFVFSPYNNKLVDVTGLKSGSLAADPQYPASERKYFYVP